MSRERPLQGSCSCGRNNYVILVPEDAARHAHVFFDAGNANRQGLLSAFLRVPLTWYQSTTTSFFPDETHSSIRRSFTPPHEPHSKRHFCGMCGTHLSYWTEKPASEAEYISATVGSLRGQDIRALEDLHLLPDDIEAVLGTPDDGQENATRGRDDGHVTRSVPHDRSGNISWFEEMIDGSKLGRAHTTRRGVGRSADGTSTVEWEITEYGEPEPVDTSAGGAKRKIGAMGGGEDSEMQQ